MPSIPTSYGDVIITLNHLNGHLTIDRADQCIRIAEDVLDEIKRGQMWRVTYSDDLVEIRAEDEIVRYRVGEYLPEQRAYEAEREDG